VVTSFPSCGVIRRGAQTEATQPVPAHVVLSGSRRKFVGSKAPLKFYFALNFPLSPSLAQGRPLNNPVVPLHTTPERGEAEDNSPFGCPTAWTHVIELFLTPSPDLPAAQHGGRGRVSLPGVTAPYLFTSSFPPLVRSFFGYAIRKR